MYQFNRLVLTLASVALTGATQAANTPASRALESEPFSCYDSLDCGECVVNGCSWAAGQCLNNCMEIADASCYNAFDLGLNSEEVCELVRMEENDMAKCGAQTDCSGCTSTSLSGGQGNCFWHPKWNTCKPVASDGWSVGTDVCLPPEEEKCFMAGSSSGCSGCLEAGCEWTDGGCLASCDMIADASCWSPRYFEEQSIDEICLQADTAALDQMLCSSAEENCSSCTSIKKSDGKSSCGWYTDEMSGHSWCGTGECDMFGNCGSSTCDVPQTETKVQGSCSSQTSCSSCLSEDNNCAWVHGTCLESCDLIADAACYTLKTFPGKTGEEICDIVETMEADESKCNAKTCQGCTAATKSDGKPCSWYSDDAGNGWCGIGGCDMSGNCGSSDSSKCPATSQKGSVRGGANHRSSFLNALLP